MHSEELHNLYSLTVIFGMINLRMVRWMGYEAHEGETRNVYRLLVGKSEGKRSLRRPRHRWEDNTKIDLREIQFEGMDQTHWLRIVSNGRLFLTQ
jgi:hypothetical protein